MLKKFHILNKKEDKTIETLLSALTTAATSVTQLFVSFFSGLSDAFIVTVGTGSDATQQLSFIGGVLVIGLVVMIAFMILRWIISLVKGI